MASASGTDGDPGVRRDRRDRRAAHARYVLFGDEDGAHRMFVRCAEEAYGRIARTETWTTGVTIDLPTRQPVVEKRGLLRRPRPATATVAMVATTVSLVLAEAYRTAREEPASMDAIAGCAAGRRAAHLMGGVLAELVADLAVLPVAEQRTGADYRQVMRLAAELTALTEVTREHGCVDPLGCVALQRPEAGGRRSEDVEVTRVRAMLLHRSKTVS